MFKIVSDSSCDIFELEGADFSSVPLTIVAGDREFADIKNANVEEMVTYLKGYKGKSGSSCPSTEAWLKAFADADEIFALTITSGLSGSYNSACVARDMCLADNPHKKIYIIDSLSAGPELTLILNKLNEYNKEGLSFEEVGKKIEEYKKSTGLMFMLQSLKNLANNGRTSHAVAKIASLLGICLIGKASDEGTLEPLGKSRGIKKAISHLLELMIENGYCGKRVIISHCFNRECAEELKKKIRDLFINAEVFIQTTGILCSFYAEEGGMLVGYEK